MKLTILLITIFAITTYRNSYFINSKVISTTGSSIKDVNHWLHNPKPLSSGILIQNIVKLQDSIKLNTFTKLPYDVQGCVCYFYLSKVDEKKGKYIMAEIFAQIAYISIDGKMQKFNLIDFKDKEYYIYSNGSYTLRVEFNNKIKSDSENFSIQGKLMMFKAQKLLIKRDIIGECSC